jgi:hypothetical protein
MFASHIGIACMLKTFVRMYQTYIIFQVITNTLARPINKMLYMCIYVCIQIDCQKITINGKMVAHISLSLWCVTICICNHEKKVSN